MKSQMLHFFKISLLTGVVFLLLDLIWLLFISKKLYQNFIGDLLGEVKILSASSRNRQFLLISFLQFLLNKFLHFFNERHFLGSSFDSFHRSFGSLLHDEASDLKLRSLCLHLQEVLPIDLDFYLKLK